MNKELEKFGQVFIKDVRDRAISDIDMVLEGKYLDDEALAMSNSFKQLDSSSKDFINNLIPNIIDSCLFDFLDMIEQNEEIELKMNGINIAEKSDGLAGELYTKYGWIQKYSTERFTDK